MSNFPDTSSDGKRAIEAWFADHQKQKITAQELSERLNLDFRKTASIMGRMRDRGTISARKIGKRNHYWSGSYAEEAAEERKELLNLTPSRTHHNSTTAGSYMGEELRRNPGIPAERYAAFDLPSLVSGKRVPPRRPTSGCTSNIPYVSRRDKCL